MIRLWRKAATDSRSRLWLTSAAIHVALAALILTRTPYGLADNAGAHLATAPQVELGLLPLPLSGQNPETVAAAEPAPAIEAEPEAPQQPTEMAAEPEAPPPTEVAALAPAPSEPPVIPAPEDAAPTKSNDEPQPQAKPVKDSTSKPKPKSKSEPEPEPRERKTKPVQRGRANGATAARASGTMSGAQAERAQSGAAQANYGTLLRAEIMRRRIYPAEAASRGDEGTVMARVTIGPNGTAVSHAVVRGSGISSFDRVVPQIMARLSLPPPPGGHYTATVAIRFALD
jgi:protein TonB